MFKMTYNEAMTIQRAQMAYYRQRIGRSGCQTIRAATHCPSYLDPNESIDVIEINRLVPRGGDFETLLKWNLSLKPDPTNLNWHNAIRRGLFYSV